MIVRLICPNIYTLYDLKISKIITHTRYFQGCFTLMTMDEPK